MAIKIQIEILKWSLPKLPWPIVEEILNKVMYWNKKYYFIIRYCKTNNIIYIDIKSLVLKYLQLLYILK